MRRYRPASYSQQARKIADRFLAWEDLTEAEKSILNTYRQGLVKIRMLKRFGRKVRKINKKYGIFNRTENAL